jgi:hypothetical protein
MVFEGFNHALESLNAAAVHRPCKMLLLLFFGGLFAFGLPFTLVCRHRLSVLILRRLWHANPSLREKVASKRLTDPPGLN